MSRTFRAHPAALHEIRSFVRDQAEDGGFRSAVIDDLVLAVSEACANAIVHTNTPSLDVGCSLSSELLSIEVKDEGIFRRRVAMPELDGHGRGIPLMAALVDELTIKEGTPERPGTLVRLIKYRTDSAAPARVG